MNTVYFILLYVFMAFLEIIIFFYNFDIFWTSVLSLMIVAIKLGSNA